jgi:hypothetical protein
LMGLQGSCLWKNVKVARSWDGGARKNVKSCS